VHFCAVLFAQNVFALCRLARLCAAAPEENGAAADASDTHLVCMYVQYILRSPLVSPSRRHTRAAVSAQDGTCPSTLRTPARTALVEMKESQRRGFWYARQTDNGINILIMVPLWPTIPLATFPHRAILSDGDRPL
jgi:hypothetical protein